MFKVRHAEETVNRTFRFSKSLIDKMSAISQQEGVSLNNFVIQCCEYALQDFQASGNDKGKDN